MQFVEFLRVTLVRKMSLLVFYITLLPLLSRSCHPPFVFVVQPFIDLVCRYNPKIRSLKFIFKLHHNDEIPLSGKLPEYFSVFLCIPHPVVVLL